MKSTDSVVCTLFPLESCKLGIGVLKVLKLLRFVCRMHCAWHHWSLVSVWAWLSCCVTCVIVLRVYSLPGGKSIHKVSGRPASQWYLQSLWSFLAGTGTWATTQMGACLLVQAMLLLIFAVVVVSLILSDGRSSCLDSCGWPVLCSVLTIISALARHEQSRVQFIQWTLSWGVVVYA